MNDKKVENILKRLAERDGVPLAYVRAEIQKAIYIGMANPDPNIQAYWNSIPRKGKVPTPEEVICYIAEKAKHHQ